MDSAFKKLSEFLKDMDEKGHHVYCRIHQWIGDYGGLQMSVSLKDRVPLSENSATEYAHSLERFEEAVDRAIARYKVNNFDM